MTSNIQIFISQRIDLNSKTLNSQIFQPVRCGAIYDNKPSSIPGDETGVNISKKRESYCELTVQYWAWKNVVADYYGLFQYRRYLSFNPSINLSLMDKWGTISTPFFNNGVIHENKLDNDLEICNIVSKYDVVTMRPCMLNTVSRNSVYDQFEKNGVKLHAKDLSIIMDIIHDKFPSFDSIANDYIYKGNKLYLFNIFIMKKKFFFSYCEWLFTILEEFEKRVDMKDYSIEAYRTPGHLGERLFGIYYTYLQKTQGITSLELPVLFFENSEKNVEINTLKKDMCIPIVMTSSEFYAPYCAATIQSIIDSSSNEHSYKIFILHSGLIQKTQTLLHSMIKGKTNFQIMFINVKQFISGYNLYESPTISIETYYRMVIPEILKKYDKLIYIDSDICVNKDLYDLYNINIGDNWIGAIVDVCAAGLVNGFSVEARQYVENKLQLKNPLHQFNAGVLIINNKEFQKEFTMKYLLEFAQAGNFRFQDQDALNILCEDHVFWINQEWNFFGDPIDSYRGRVEQYAPRNIYKEYREAALNPKIVHYAGNEKPWLYPNFEWADLFWKNFIKTPFYSPYILQQINSKVTNQTNSETNNKNVVVIDDRQKGIIRKIVNYFFPLNSKRRNRLKKLLPFLTRK